MEARTRKVLDDRIDILNRNSASTSPAREVFKIVSAILALTRDRIIDGEDFVQLSEYCFNTCVALEPAIQGKSVGELNKSVRMALEELERSLYNMGEILTSGASAPYAKYSKEKVEEHKRQIQRILGVLNPQSLPLDKNLGAIEGVIPTGPVVSDAVTATSVAESACGRLIRRAFVLWELPSLVEAIFSSKDESSVVRSFRGDDAQAFIDVIDEALDRPDLPPQTRKKCLKLLYRMCGHHALLPGTLKIPVCYDRAGVALYRGGFADVWKGEHSGQDVAVKVLRTYSNSDLQKIIGKFCKEVVSWKSLRHPNVQPLMGVTMTETQFAMISEWMMYGNINDFVKAHRDVDRVRLLGGVTRGVIYIHGQGMIHGDLKGANILIDQTGHARLTDFGLLTIISDPVNLLSSSSYTQGGTARWMSPELINPQKFGFQNGRPTKWSDCYALGMVVYETISGHPPFHQHGDLTVFAKVLEGERPLRGVGFMDSLWNMMEKCWTSQPHDRPSIEVVLQCLESAFNLSVPPLPGLDEDMGTNSDNWNPMDDSFDHLFQNSGAVSASIYHGNLAGLHTSGDVGNAQTLPTNQRPHTEGDAGGAGRTIHQGIQQQGVPTLPPALPQCPAPEDVYQSLVGYIESLVPPQDATPISLHNGVCIPQRRYEHGADRDPSNNEDLVLFVRQDGSYLTVTAAVEGDYTSLVNRDIPVLGEAGYTIALQLEWPGYPSQVFQVCTYDGCNPPKRISLARLATEVGKAIQQFIERMQGQNIAPAYSGWRVGPGWTQIENLHLAALEQVSAGSWQPRLFYKPLV